MENRGSRYFVLQGNPTFWNDIRREQHTPIIDFLIAQNAVFVFSSELADQKP